MYVDPSGLAPKPPGGGRIPPPPPPSPFKDEDSDQMVVRWQTITMVAALRDKYGDSSPRVSEEGIQAIKQMFEDIRSANIELTPSFYDVFIQGLNKPVDADISSGYGLRDTSNLPAGATSNHKAFDYAVGSNTPIKAAGAGIVSSAGWDGGYGKRMEVAHGGNVYTSYSHNTSFAVNYRDVVNSGDTITYSGKTGLEGMGAHLHFEVFLKYGDENGNIQKLKVNPVAWLN